MTVKASGSTSMPSASEISASFSVSVAMLGRLLEHLGEGVKGLGRQHVDLIDDVDLHPSGGGREVYLVPEVPDLIDPAVRRRVHLQHIDRRITHDGPATLASPVRLRGGP